MTHSHSNSKSLYFAPFDSQTTPPSAPYKLIQLPSEEFLQKLLDNMERQDSDTPMAFVLKENENGFVHLCTEDESFQLQHVEYSNQMHIARENAWIGTNDDDAMDTSDDNASTKIYMETVPIRCVYEMQTICGQKERIRRQLRQIIPVLDVEKYCDGEVQLKTISFGDLERVVPASMQEIRLCLTEMDAIEVERDQFLQVDLTTLRKTIVHLVLLLQAKDLNISLEQVRQSGNIMKPEWLMQIFVVHQDDNKMLKSDSLMIDSENLPLQIDTKKLALYYAEHILFFKQKKFKLSAFLRLWEKKLDTICAVRLEWLLKAALSLSHDDEQIIMQHNDAILEYFPASQLSLDPMERFKELFAKKKTWTAHHLLPFLEDLATTDTPADKLMQKFTKGSQTMGQGEKKYILR